MLLLKGVVDVMVFLLFRLSLKHLDRIFLLDLQLHIND